MTSDRTAIITGASTGLGLALARGLVADGWRVIADARDGARLRAALTPLGPAAHAVPGDVTDPGHRAALVRAAEATGRLDLLVHNASALGPSPLPGLDRLAGADLVDLLVTNVV